MTDYCVRTIRLCTIEFDPVKNEVNILKHGLSFERAAEFDFATALYAVDIRRDYGENKIRALGFLDNRLHALVFVETSLGIRIISFRKANRLEVTHYETQTQT
jgi:uncharacterized DUF497 family protein